jgi:hypothetical protein
MQIVNGKLPIEHPIRRDDSAHLRVAHPANIPPIYHLHFAITSMRCPRILRSAAPGIPEGCHDCSPPVHWWEPVVEENESPGRDN